MQHTCECAHANTYTDASVMHTHTHKDTHTKTHTQFVRRINSEKFPSLFAYSLHSARHTAKKREQSLTDFLAVQLCHCKKNGAKFSPQFFPEIIYWHTNMSLAQRKHINPPEKKPKFPKERAYTHLP